MENTIDKLIIEFECATESIEKPMAALAKSIKKLEALGNKNTLEPLRVSLSKLSEVSFKKLDSSLDSILTKLDKLSNLKIKTVAPKIVDPKVSETTDPKFEHILNSIDAGLGPKNDAVNSVLKNADAISDKFKKVSEAGNAISLNSPFEKFNFASLNIDFDGMLNGIENPISRTKELMAVVTGQIESTRNKLTSALSEQAPDNDYVLSLEKRAISLTNNLDTLSQKLNKLIADDLKNSSEIDLKKIINFDEIDSQLGNLLDPAEQFKTKLAVLADEIKNAKIDFSKVYAADGENDPKTIAAKSKIIELLDKEAKLTAKLAALERPPDITDVIDPHQFAAKLANLDGVAKPIERVQLTIKLLKEEIAGATERLNKMKEAVEGSTGNLGDLDDAFKVSSDDVNKELQSIVRLSASLETYQKQLKKLQHEQTNNVVTKMLKSFGRVLRYRIFRSIIRNIVKAGKEGLQNIVQYSEDANKALSNVHTAGVAVSNVMGVALVSGIKAIEPALMGLADVFITIMNGFNALVAALSGAKTYTKVMTATEAATKANIDYADSINNARRALFSFDKFESLSNQTDPAAMFSTEEVKNPLTEIGAGFTDILDKITELNDCFELLVYTIGTLLALKVASWTGGFLTNLMNLVTGINTSTAAAKSLNTMFLLLKAAGIALIIYGISDLVKNWDSLDAASKALRFTLIALGVAILFIPKTAFTSFLAGIPKMVAGFTQMTLGARTLTLSLGLAGALGAFFGLTALFKSLPEEVKKIAAIFTILAGVVVAVAAAALAMHGALTVGVAVPIILTAVGAGVAGIMALVPNSSNISVPDFADGGIPARTLARGGSLFSMDEHGKAELMYENSGRQVEISNQESLETSFYNALVAWDINSNSRSARDKNVVLEINGREFARSIYSDFKAEQLRRG